MSTVSGRSAALSLGGTTMPSLREWSLENSADNSEGYSSGSQNMPVLTEGPQGWNVRAAFYGYLPPACTPGTTYAFIGYGADRAEGNVICTGLDFTINVKTGETISGLATFQGTGALALAAGAAVTDAGPPRHYTGMKGNVRWQPIIAGVAGTEADIPDVETMTFSLRCTVDEYHTSDTQPWKGYTAGVLSASGSWTHKQGAWAATQASATRFQPGAVGVLKYYVTATAFYQFSYACISRVGIPKVDREKGTTIEMATAWGYTGATNIGGTMTMGTIILPDSAVFWP